MFKSRVKKEEGRKDWVVLSFRKQRAVIWGLRWFFVLRRQSGKRQAHWTGLSDAQIQEEGRETGRSHQQEPRWKKSQDCRQQPRDGSVQTRDSWWPPNVEKRRLDQKLAQQTDGTRDKPLQLPASVSSSLNQANQLLRSFQHYNLAEKEHIVPGIFLVLILAPKNNVTLFILQGNGPQWCILTMWFSKRMYLVKCVCRCVCTAWISHPILSQWSVSAARFAGTRCEENINNPFQWWKSLHGILFNE